jgi:hypothetical protein
MNTVHVFIGLSVGIITDDDDDGDDNHHGMVCSRVAGRGNRQPPDKELLETGSKRFRRISLFSYTAYTSVFKRDISCVAWKRLKEIISALNKPVALKTLPFHLETYDPLIRITS